MSHCGAASRGAGDVLNDKRYTRRQPLRSRSRARRCCGTAGLARPLLVAPIAPGGHLRALPAASWLVHERHAARVEELTDAISLGEVVRAARLVAVVDELLDLVHGGHVRARLAAVDLPVRGPGALPLRAGAAATAAALLLRRAIIVIVVAVRHPGHSTAAAAATAAAECGTAGVARRIHELVLRQVQLQIRDRLAVVTAELLVVIVHALEELLHLLDRALVALVARARDAELQGLGALLLPGALEVPGAHAAETELRLGLANDALHVGALGADDASRHLELLVVLDADEEAASVLPHALLVRDLVSSAHAHAHGANSRRHSNAGDSGAADVRHAGPSRSSRRHAPASRTEGDARERWVRRRRSQGVADPADAERPVQPLKDLAVEVVHGRLSLVDVVEDNLRGRASLVNVDLLDAAVSAEDLVEIVVGQLVLELHALHRHGDGGLGGHGGCVRRHAGEAKSRHAQPRRLRGRGLLQILEHLLHVSLRQGRVHRRHAPEAERGVRHGRHGARHALRHGEHRCLHLLHLRVLHRSLRSRCHCCC
mmetsp:Transcript_17676/g.38911  ORF Transcript_17676/g.38911 Transcript_17676/m.38911 type:complete len:543 (+) Transcript_17676:137-1765(+)